MSTVKNSSHSTWQLYDGQHPPTPSIWEILTPTLGVKMDNFQNLLNVIKNMKMCL